MLFGQTAKGLHRHVLDGVLGCLGHVGVLTDTCEDVGHRRLLCGVGHVHVEQLLVEPGLLGQASLGQHVGGQLGCKRLFFLCGKFFLGERFGRFALGLAHAGETHLLRLTLCLLLRHLRFQLLNLSLGLRNGGLLHRCRLLGQTHIVGTVDQLTLTVSQVRVGEALTLEFADKRFGDVAHFRLDDRQQQLQALVLSRLLFLGRNLPVEFGNVGLHLEALLLGLGLLHLKLFAQPRRLLLSLKLLDLLGLQLVDHVAGALITCRCRFFDITRSNFFPLGYDLAEQIWLRGFKLARPGLTLEQGHLASLGGSTLGRCNFLGGGALWPHDRLKLALCSVKFSREQLTLRTCGSRPSRRGTRSGGILGTGLSGASAACATAQRQVQNHTGNGTDTGTVCAFFACAFDNCLLGLVDSLGDQVLCDLLRRFGCALDTTTGQGCGDDVLQGADVGGQQVQQAGGCTHQGSGAALLGSGTFGFCALACFTCASGNTEATSGYAASQPSGAEGKERQCRAQTFAELAANRVLITFSGLKRLLRNTSEFLDGFAC